MKILIVDDSRSNLAVLRQYVEHLGATALCAEDDETALRLFEQSRPDLILLDIAQPTRDGLAVARQVRAMEKAGEWTPIIFLSAPDRDDEIEKGIAAGGDDYLLRPISEIALGAKIRTMQRLALMRTSLLSLTRKLDAANQELIRISSSDSLTGIANRRYFEEALSIEWRRARRHSNPVALLMCDIDSFKLFNDTYGHLAGDEVLKAVAAVCAESVRGNDCLARLGGEEFAVLMPETGLGEAGAAAERLRIAVEQLRCQLHEGLVTPTVSIGVAITEGAGESLSSLMRRGDQAMYAAKAQGRNRVVIAPPLVA